MSSSGSVIQDADLYKLELEYTQSVLERWRAKTLDNLGHALADEKLEHQDLKKIQEEVTNLGDLRNLSTRMRGFVTFVRGLFYIFF